MKEALAIAFAVGLWMYASAASSFNIESEVEKQLRPVAIHIRTIQQETPPSQWQDILEALQTSQQQTTNTYTRLGLWKLITTVQTIIDNDLYSAPSSPIVNALAATYTK